MSRFIAAVVATGLFISPTFGQSLKDRIDVVRRQNAAATEAGAERQAAQKTLAALRMNLSDVDLKDLSAREAIKWLADASGLEIVVNWDQMENEGLDTEQAIELTGRNMTVARVLTMIARQLAGDEPLLWEATPYYVELMTKNQANQRTVVLVYPIQDLLQEVPNFGDQAPTFDLQQISQSSNQGFGGGSGGGGRGGGSGGGIFNNSNNTTEDNRPTTAERGEEIASLIRDTVEPDIWRENGGTAGSIRYYNGNLIIRAPMYVHQQIGGSGATLGDPQPAAAAPGARTDRRYVQLNMRYSDASVTGIRQVPFNAAVVGRGGTGPATAAFRYPRGHGVAGISGR